MDHPLGQMLLEAKLVTEQQLEEALDLERRTSKFLGKILVELNVMRETDLLELLSQRFNLPVVELEDREIAPEAIAMLSAEIVQRHRCIPLQRENGRLTVALTNPLQPRLLEELGFVSGCTVSPVLCKESEIIEATEKYYDVTVEKILKDMSEGEEIDPASDEYFIHNLQEKASEPTLINLVNLIVTQGIQDEASDIHIEPFEKEMKIKYRIDGVLHETPPPPRNMQPAIVSRVKIMAGMDIAKRHVPQDGHIRINITEGQVDIRVSTIPTVFGESVVLRLLNKTSTQLSLEDLGMEAETLRRFDLLLARTHGIVLVCGPTGSGKTTTLYGALTKIYTPSKKIITIEEPVEYQLNGIIQIPVRVARGVTFASGLRSVLRHDPDILMVGEVRDKETAEIAIRCALTGHLIFSTLHTNDAASSITRLIDMGVEPYLIASSLEGALAQRLVRRLCPYCRKPVTPTKLDLAQFGQTLEQVRDATFFQAEGCDQCRRRGYSGRLGIFELMLMNERLQQMILDRESSHLIKNEALSTMSTMRESGWDKIKRGVTTFDEVLRQTQLDQLDQLEANSLANAGNSEAAGG